MERSRHRSIASPLSPPLLRFDLHYQHPWAIAGTYSQSQRTSSYMPTSADYNGDDHHSSDSDADGEDDSNDDHHSTRSSRREWNAHVAAMAIGSDDSPLLLRRSSSAADIPIPSFMIPSSAHELMNAHYALAPHARCSDQSDSRRPH